MAILSREDPQADPRRAQGRSDRPVSPGSEGRVPRAAEHGRRHWAQHAYQFAHEFGHILANYDEHERHNKWFEESICETASLFVLRRMSETWKVRPPYPNWKDYIPALAKYADERIGPRSCRPARRSRSGTARTNRCSGKEPCLRDKNTVVAVALLPLFEKRPENWEAITWLNDGKPHGERTFARYLGDWHARVPENSARSCGGSPGNSPSRSRTRTALFCSRVARTRIRKQSCFQLPETPLREAKGDRFPEPKDGQQYRARLCQLVEREMNRRFRRKEDPEDVVQSAFRTFYRHNAKGEFRIDSSVDLWPCWRPSRGTSCSSTSRSWPPGSGT